MLPLRVYPFPFAISACLCPPPSLPQSAPSHPSLSLSLSLSLYLPESPSTYTRRVLFTSGRRNAPSLFPLWWWNGREQTGRERREGDREVGGEEREEGGGRWGRGVYSHWQLCPETIALFPHLQQVSGAVVAWCLHLTLLSFSLSLTTNSNRLRHSHMNKNNDRNNTTSAGVYRHNHSKQAAFLTPCALEDKRKELAKQGRSDWEILHATHH